MGILLVACVCSVGRTHTFTQSTNLYFNIYPCIFIFRTVFVHSTYFHICVWETCQIRSLLTWLGPPIGHYFNLCNLQSKSTRKRLYSWNNQNKIVRKQFMKMCPAYFGPVPHIQYNIAEKYCISPKILWFSI